VRVFISYAHDDAVHEDRVRDFWFFLRAQGIDARLDRLAAERQVDWVQWMTQQIRDADYVLVIASAEYKRRTDSDAVRWEGRGVQWEARLIREMLYADQEAGWQRVAPVVLPGCSADDIPFWLGPRSTTCYLVNALTVHGAQGLLRMLTSQPSETMPPLGMVPVLPPRAPGEAIAAQTRPALITEVVIEAALSGDGVLDSVVSVAGSQLCRRQAPLAAEVAGVWEALRLPAVAARSRMADVGRRLAAALFDDSAAQLLAGLVNRLPPGDTVDVVLNAVGPALSLPVELIRLTTSVAVEVNPLGLMPAVSVSRRLVTPGQSPGLNATNSEASAAGMAGPLKVLAAVAAPDETKTKNVPLDVEAEMQAVLHAVTSVAENPHAQVRIVEVASLSAIREALQEDAYHVLHLSAHGSPESVELEDEDGAPAEVTPEALMQALRHAGRPVPLIVLSSRSGGSEGSSAMAAELIAQGAGRVVAMLFPVSDAYATVLARHFYRELSAHPALTVGQALARARYLAEEDRLRAAVDHLPAPEYGSATLLAAGRDTPLVDPVAPEVPLTVMTTPPGGKLVRELPIGALIGRRAQLRNAMGVLRRAEHAVQRFGATSGVQLTGVGGIGKTALAGRVISRLRDDGWLIAVHEGRWNPTVLISAVADAIGNRLSRICGPGQADALRSVLTALTDPDSDDGPKLAAISWMLATRRLLVVFDDFEQNLIPGGEAFLDLAIDDVMVGLAAAADTGALLVTSRYPLPGPDLFLAQVPIPALSAAELRRLFLRLPALHSLDAEDQRLLTRTIGGHPRLIEFADALLRGGHANLKHVQVKLRDLARAEGVDLHASASLSTVLDQSMLLGGADILLTELIGLLTSLQAGVLLQVAVCRAEMTLDDLAFTFGLDPDPVAAIAGSRPDISTLRADVDRLIDLTLLTPRDSIVMHPWTADLVSRNAETDLSAQHERALAMRFRRFQQQRGSYDDLIDIPRHLAALRQYDDIPAFAKQAIKIVHGTLATVAYLAEIRPLIPPVERAWIVVADLEVQALLSAGDLSSATRQLRAIHQQVQARAASDPANGEWQRDLSVSYNFLGNVALAAGDLGGARAAYQASLDNATRLAVSDPTNAGWQRDLSVSHNFLGDVALAAGDLAAARAAYQTSLDIRARLATTDPANMQWQRDLSVDHDNLGDVAVAAGDLSSARAHYQASLDIRVLLAAADPANTGWQRDLSVSHDYLGNVAVAAGDLAAARASYQASMDIAARLAAADPANSVWQRDLSVGHDNLGDMAMATGDLALARAAYQASLDIGVRLAATDPANTGWQRDLSVSHIKLGNVMFAAGDLAAARASYQASMDIAARLAAADPANTGWQRDLSVSHNNLGDVATATGDLAAARAAYQACRDISSRLVAADSANSVWQRDLSVSHNKLGNLAATAGDLAAARAAYETSLDIRVRLATADPANTVWQRDLSVSYDNLGNVAAKAGDLPAARAAYQASLDVSARLAAADPANSVWQRDLSVSHNHLGNVIADAGDLAAARAHYQASLDVSARLAAADPANTGWQRDLSVSHENLGDIAADAGELAAARAYYQASLDIRERLAAADPANMQWQRDLQIVFQRINDLPFPSAGDAR
jgi:tetratricopeptide (TPR) repeat protein